MRELSPEQPSPPSRCQHLDGRSFVSSDITGHELVADSDAGLLTAGPFASTMMACEQPLMDQDTWLSDFLTSSPNVALDGSTLPLTIPRTPEDRSASPSTASP